MNPLDLLKFVESNVEPSNQLNVLALLGEPPAEDFAPLMSLPTQNVMPAVNLGDGGVGSMLANMDYAIPAPVFGEADFSNKSIGELITGEIE